MRVSALALALLVGTLACRADPSGGAPAGAPDVAALVRQLGDRDLARRSGAQEALLELDEAAIPFLRKALASEDVEAAARAQEILDRLSTFPFQLRRWGRRGVREESLGERWFAGYEDGQPRLVVGTRLDRAPTGEEGYVFRVNFGGDCDVRGRLGSGFSVKSYTASFAGGSTREFVPPADPKKALFYPELLVWFCPFWEIPVQEQELLSVSFQDLKQNGIWTLLSRHGEEDVPCPGGRRRGESVRLRGAGVVWQIWWDAQDRLIKILGAGQQEYFPVSRDEAAKAAGGLEWWK